MSGTERYEYAFDPDSDAWAARLLRQLPAAGSVLELGPGPGVMTKVLAALGYQVTVVENDPQALEALQPLQAAGVRIARGDLEGYEWQAQLHQLQQLHGLQEQRFDAILACDVLEHLHQPQALLAALPHWLVPEGRLVISVPNIAYAGVVAALRNGVFDYADKGQLDRTHVHFFTRRSMEAALLETGWVPRHWKANRVPVEQSEFAWCWDTLSPPLRQELQAHWTDFDVYQWMTVATPATGGHVAQAAYERAVAEELRAQLYALKALYGEEHASLLEHQKAFGEAKEIIACYEGETAALQQALKDTQTQLQAALAEKGSFDKAGKLNMRAWWQRYKKSTL